MSSVTVPRATAAKHWVCCRQHFSLIIAYHTTQVLTGCDNNKHVNVDPIGVGKFMPSAAIQSDMGLRLPWQYQRIEICRQCGFVDRPDHGVGK